MDMKETLFELAAHEKGLSWLGAFTEEDEQWFNDALGFPNGFEHDDVASLSIQDICDLINEFIICISE